MIEIDSFTAKYSSRIAIVSLFFNVVLAAACVYFALQPRGSLHCDDLGSYTDALAALQNNPQLDGFPHDGIPCDARFKDQPKKIR